MTVARAARVWVLAAMVAAGWPLTAAAGEPASMPASGPASKPANTPASRPDSATQWPLPRMDKVDPLAFRVSGDGRWVILPYINEASAASTQPTEAEIGCYLLNTLDGKVINLLECFKDQANLSSDLIVGAEASADGKYIAVRTMKTDRASNSSVWLLNTDTRALELVGEGAVAYPVWVGAVLGVSTADKEGLFLPMRLQEPGRSTPLEMRVHAVISAAAPRGDFMICICDPQDASRAVSIADLKSGQAVLACMDLAGIVLRKLCPARDVGTVPVVSPCGKFISFQYNGWKGEAFKTPPDVVRVTVLASRLDESWSINEAAVPIFLTDDGEAVTLAANGDGNAPIKVWEKGGKTSRVLVDGAWAAAVAGTKLFYVTGAEQKTVHAVRLDLSK